MANEKIEKLQREIEELQNKQELIEHLKKSDFEKGWKIVEKLIDGQEDLVLSSAATADSTRSSYINGMVTAFHFLKKLPQSAYRDNAKTLNEKITQLNKQLTIANEQQALSEEP
jgi:hypothetical protein